MDIKQLEEVDSLLFGQYAINQKIFEKFQFCIINLIILVNELEKKVTALEEETKELKSMKGE